jgi:hypothetical protein
MQTIPNRPCRILQIAAALFPLVELELVRTRAAFGHRSTLAYGCAEIRREPTSSLNSVNCGYALTTVLG